jgi:limonene-1,2-epoxide hydrolase
VAEESTTPGALEAIRHFVKAINAKDYQEAAAAATSPDSVYDLSRSSMGIFKGRQAIRGFYEDWLAPYSDFKVELDEWRDLGNGVTFHVLRHRGQLAPGTGWVELRRGYVSTWGHEFIERSASYPEIDEARAAAERLAQERG